MKISNEPYVRNGFENRKQYYDKLAEKYSLELYTVIQVGNELGHEEDFNKLPEKLAELVEASQISLNENFEFNKSIKLEDLINNI